jgi:hypothetical protein
MRLEDRRGRFARVFDFLASRSELELIAMTRAGDGVVEVRGGSVIFEVDGLPVFAKRIPLTELELAHPLSTANLFDLPMFCHFFFGVPAFPRFGFGGPAMNGWRELAANLIVTEGVLAGEAEGFPLLYHWRVLPVRPHITGGPDDIDALVAELDGSPAVRARMEALRTADHSLVLFGEHLPHPLTAWLDEDPAAKAEPLEHQLLQTMAFLRRHELLQLDGQLANLRTDGERLHLTDFGLATSTHFDLTPSERSFVASIATHDTHYASLKLVHWAASALCGVPDPKIIDPATGEFPDWRIRAEFVRRCADGDLPDGLSPIAAGILTRHAAPAWRIFRFYRRLIAEDLSTPYPAENLPYDVELSLGTMRMPRTL